MTVTQIDDVKNRISNILNKYAGINPIRSNQFLSNDVLPGKLYEAYVLAHVCRSLVKKEKLEVRLVNGSSLVLKQKGSGINRKYPYFQVYKAGSLYAELFTDTYFYTLSHFVRGGTSHQPGDYHELDIALLRPNISNYPKHSDILIGIECKNTSIKKNIIREVIGFRRELSLLPKNKILTGFSFWPAPTIMANPSSVHIFYCSDPSVRKYESNCEVFGILIKFLKP